MPYPKWNYFGKPFTLQAKWNLAVVIFISKKLRGITIKVSKCSLCLHIILHLLIRKTNIEIYDTPINYISYCFVNSILVCKFLNLSFMFALLYNVTSIKSFLLITYTRWLIQTLPMLFIINICDPSQQNRAVVCYQEKCDIPFIWKSILLTQRWYHSCVK